MSSLNRLPRLREQLVSEEHLIAGGQRREGHRSGDGHDAVDLERQPVGAEARAIMHGPRPQPAWCLPAPEQRSRRP